MAKKKVSLNNPVTQNGGNLLSASEWAGSILWFVRLGLAMAAGAWILSKIDKVVPGTQTPNSAVFQTNTPVVSGVVEL